MKVTVDTGYRPHKFQLEVHNSLKRFSVLVCHRRWGKTVLAVNTLVDSALRKSKHPDRRYAYIAPLLKQSKDVSWLYLKRYTAVFQGVKINESELSVTLPNDSRIRLYGADNPEGLRGLYLDGVVLDEVADMKPEVWGEVIRPLLADRKGWALFIGTPKGLNLFSDLYYSAIADSSWYAGMFRASQTIGTPGIPIDAEEIERARADMSENKFRQEFECDFSASTDDTLIPIDVVAAASGKALRDDQYSYAPVVLGVDVARFGDDRSVIVRRQGLAAFEPIIQRGLDNMQLADLVAREILSHNPAAVFVDAGRGEGVIDRLRQLGHDVIEVNFGGAASENVYANKRAEMWFGLADWFKAGGAIPDHSELRRDLVVPTYGFNSSGQKLLEKKEDMKKRVGFSPDLGDALALTFAYPVSIDSDRLPPRVQYDALSFHEQQQTQRVSRSYNPGDWRM